MDLYRLLLFVHVLAAGIWVGGAVTTYLLGERMYATNDRGALRTMLAQYEKMGQFLFMPAALGTLIAGLLLVWEGSWDWTEPFVLVGLLGIVATIFVGAIALTGKEKAFEEALEKPETSETDLRALFMQVRTLSRIDVGLIVVIIFFMTVKPGT